MTTGNSRNREEDQTPLRLSQILVFPIVTVYLIINVIKQLSIQFQNRYTRNVLCSGCVECIGSKLDLFGCQLTFRIWRGCTERFRPLYCLHINSFDSQISLQLLEIAHILKGPRPP